MADVGVRVANVDQATIVDQILGVLDGSVRLIFIERLVALLQARLGPTYATRADLLADLDWPDGVFGYVSGDATAGYNGIYRKGDSAGAGSWTRVGDLPTSAVEAAQIAAVADDLAAEITRAQTAENLKAPIASPALTGTPTMPTAAPGTASTQGATTAFVAAAITALIGGAPATLNTLAKIATALGSDPAFSTTMSTALAQKAPLASPALTGTPTAPNALVGTNTTQIATTAFASTIRDGVLAISSIQLMSVAGADAITAVHHTFAAGVAAAQAGQIYVLKFAATNTTSAVTLSISGSTPLPVYDAHGAALAPGDLQGGAYGILACVNGTRYRVISTLMTPAQVRAEVARLDVDMAAAQAEDVEIWGRQSELSTRTAPIVALPTLPVGLREIEPTQVSYDLCVTEGRWSDTGLPWAADGRYDGTVLLPETITDDVGAVIVVTLWSYDLCPLAGYYADTGAPWLADAVDVLPEMMVETAVDQVIIYTKSGAADRPTYVQHRMEHYVDAARNIDVWRTDQPSEARRRSDGTFEVVQRIFQNSEVDSAIQLTGRIDFSGGKMHGNEEMTRTPIWMIDGVQIDPAAGLTYAPHRVELIQTTRMYDPGAAAETQYVPRGAAFVELTKRHRWQDGEYLLRTHVKELYVDGLTTVLRAAFLMAPIMRIDTADGVTQITHSAMRPPYYGIEDVSDELFTTVKTTADRVVVWGDRYAVEWRAIEGWSNPHRVVYVDNRTAYNKIYPWFFYGSTHSLTGAEYDVESAFRITIQEPTQ